MAEQVDMQGLLGGLLPNRENADKAEGLRLADLVGKSGATAAYLQPAQARRLRQGVGGMFGLDMRNEAEKVEDQLRELGTPNTAEEHKKYADVLDKYKPGAGVTYMMGVAQEARDKIRADATATSAGAQETNANVNRDFAERDMAAQEAKIKVEEGALILAGTTQEDLVRWRKVTEEQNARGLVIKEQQAETDKMMAELAATDLDSRSLAAVREATEAGREFTLMSNAARNLANEYLRLDPMGGQAAIIVDKWKNLTGNTDEYTEARENFNRIKNSLVMESLPPGVASDVDIEIAMSGFPSETASAETIISFMKGMAKLNALAGAESQARATFMTEAKGNDAGFAEFWRKKTNEPGFAEQLATEQGLIWRPQENTDGYDRGAVSDREMVNRRQAVADLERATALRDREKSVEDVAAFINQVNGQGY